MNNDIDQQRGEAFLQATKGLCQVVGGVSLAAGKGTLGAFLCNHHLANMALRFGGQKVADGMENFRAGRDRLRSLSGQ